MYMKSMYRRSPKGAFLRSRHEAELGVFSAELLLIDLKYCTIRRDLLWGRRIHAKLVQLGNVSSKHVASVVMRMYAKSGSMVDAHRVFQTIEKLDATSWNALLLGYVHTGKGHIALDLFAEMKAAGFAPDFATYALALNACTSVMVNGDESAKAQALDMGQQIHAEVDDQLDIYIQCALIDMYAKGSCMSEARQVFDSIHEPDQACWNALLLGYAENGEGEHALKLFSRMKADGCEPNSGTYISVLKACTSLAVNGHDCAKAQALKCGRRIHREAGSHLTLYVQNTLIDMYAKCGSMVEAHQVFDKIKNPQVVSWTVLLLGYAEDGKGQVALDLFSEMAAKCTPDAKMYVAVLKACIALAMKGNKVHGLQSGRAIHSEIRCHHLNPYVQNTLIDMYVKCGSMVEARGVFDNVEKPDVFGWSALLMGYAENGEAQVALNLFSKMKSTGCVPDAVTYVAVLKACTSLQSLELGREIHLEIPSAQNTLVVQNTLVDMYAKCGRMVEARQVFDAIPKPNAVSWNALLLGYEENGDGRTALDLFLKMKAAGCAPTAVTYIAALKSCGSTGDLVLGRKIHSEITEFTVQLVTSLVDLYAKCGSMAEARELFDLHLNTRGISTWNALLAGYSSCGNTGEVFGLFEVMQDTGVQPDGVTFVSILLCCSHAGLVGKTRAYLEAMPAKYGVPPNVFHYNCMLDVLCRANQLFEAVSVLRKMPCNPNAVTWRAISSACHQSKNAHVGKLAFQSLVEIDGKDSSAYVLMSRSRLEDARTKQLEW